MIFYFLGVAYNFDIHGGRKSGENVYPFIFGKGMSIWTVNDYPDAYHGRQQSQCVARLEIESEPQSILKRVKNKFSFVRGQPACF